jgi:group II intron reverse transcriptase/maturase
VVDRAVKHGYQWVVDADLEAFFDTVDHQKLIAALNEEIADGSVLNLVTQILKAGVSLPKTARVEPTEWGTPQGGPLSPLLANVYLHHFDTRMVQAGYGLVRYADDFVLFARSESEAAAALTLARQVLEEELGLRLHPEKTRVVSVTHGFAFLGFHYFRDPTTGQLRKEVRRKSAQRFREQVRRLTPRLKNQRRVKARKLTSARLAKNQRLGAMIRALNAFLRGWHWYFKAVWSPYATPFRDFDGFVRRRVRAALTGGQGAGWWNQRLSNALLRELGLIPLDEWHREYLSGQLASPARKGRPGGEPDAGKPHVRFGKAGGRVTAPGPSSLSLPWFQPPGVLSSAHGWIPHRALLRHASPRSRFRLGISRLVRAHRLRGREEILRRRQQWLSPRLIVGEQVLAVLDQPLQVRAREAFRRRYQARQFDLGDGRRHLREVLAQDLAARRLVRRPDLQP